MNPEPIFILGAHKSGTSLLRSIFDGHSELSVLPIETHVFQKMGYWIRYEYRKQHPQSPNLEKVKNKMARFIHKVNNQHDQYSGSHAKNLIDEKLFNEHLNNYLTSQDPAQIISTYFDALHLSIHNSTSAGHTKRYVEKSVEHSEFALELNQLFPQARFIHIVRNPYATVVALRKYKTLGYRFPLYHRLAKTLVSSFYHLHKNSRLLSNYYVIRYEDLVATPEIVIRELADFVNINWEQILLTPTVNGIPWEGNSTTGNEYDTISDKNLDNWKEEIHPVEVFYVNRLFTHILERYNYDKIPYNGGFIRPVSNETPLRYLANRLYRFYLID